MTWLDWLRALIVFVSAFAGASLGCLTFIRGRETRLINIETRIGRVERARWTDLESTRRLDSVEERISRVEDLTRERGITE